MNSMSTAPRTGQPVLVEWPNGERTMVTPNYADDQFWHGPLGGHCHSMFLSGWWDIDALIADRARLTDLLRKALAYIPSITRVTPEGCDESMVQPHPLRAAIEKELQS